MQQMIEWIKEQRGEGGSKGDRGEDGYDEIKAKLMIRTDTGTADEKGQ